MVGGESSGPETGSGDHDEITHRVVDDVAGQDGPAGGRPRLPSASGIDGDHLFFFGYQKWWEYEAQTLIPFISNGPLISWMYPVFGIRGASWFLGVSEWLFGALIFIGFWNKTLGALGAAGSCVTFVMTITIIPFMPDGWAASAGGFPAMTGNVPFLMKDVVLLAVSVYLLKQDAVRATMGARAETVTGPPSVGRPRRTDTVAA